MFCLNCNKELTKYQKKFCSNKCKIEYQHKINVDKYYEKPKICKNCGKIIPYEKRKTSKSFCCSSCSASFNNRKKVVSEETKRKVSETLKKLYPKKEKPQCNIKKVKHNRFKKKYICKVCGKEYYFIKGECTKKCCSKECSIEIKLNRKKYLSEETLKKLSESGRKSAKIQFETRRSKNEKYFYELCKSHFENVRHNEPIFNGWDADIIIDDIKYAILWNGKWHYEIIKKDTSLLQIQNRDKIKVNEIIKCGYTPYIIKDMGKYNIKFVTEEFEKFLEKIK